MTDQYEDDEGRRERVLSNSQVLGFIAAFWLRRRGLLSAAVGLTLVSIGFDLAMPWAAGRLVDAVVAGPAHVDQAWKAWAAFVGVYLAFSLIRNLAFRFWNPLAAANMKAMTDEGFARVQAFSPTGTPTPSPARPCGGCRGRCGAMTRCPTPWCCGWAPPSWCWSGCPSP